MYIECGRIYLYERRPLNIDAGDFSVKVPEPVISMYFVIWHAVCESLKYEAYVE
jgi:hypothetical protein